MEGMGPAWTRPSDGGKGSPDPRTQPCACTRPLAPGRSVQAADEAGALTGSPRLIIGTKTTVRGFSKRVKDEEDPELISPHRLTKNAYAGTALVVCGLRTQLPASETRA